MQLGGPPLVIQTVKQLTGLPITHYVQINFWGFKDMVDAIGGVWVNVPERISDIRAANHDSSAMVVEKGYQKLDGKHALTFVRSRKYAEADYTRMKNQQTFIKALMKQTLQAGNLFRISAITQAMLHNVVTDMKLDQVLALVNDFKDMNPNSIETATMPSTPKYIDKVAYVILDEQGMQNMVARLAEGKPLKGPDTTATAGAAGGAGDQAVLPANVTVTVRNGAGLHAVAADATTKLKAGGFKVPETGNAQRFVYQQTLVIYKDDLPKAEAVQQVLGAGRIVKGRGMYSFKTDILVVVGKDWKIGARRRAPTRTRPRASSGSRPVHTDEARPLTSRGMLEPESWMRRTSASQRSGGTHGNGRWPDRAQGVGHRAHRHDRRALPLSLPRHRPCSCRAALRHHRPRLGPRHRHVPGRGPRLRRPGRALRRHPQALLPGHVAGRHRRAPGRPGRPPGHALAAVALDAAGERRPAVGGRRHAHAGQAGEGLLLHVPGPGFGRARVQGRQR